VTPGNDERRPSEGRRIVEQTGQVDIERTASGRDVSTGRAGEQDETPIVVAHLERGGRTVRVLCPFCSGPRGGRRWHVHGLGDNRATYGPRSSHCWDAPTRTYFLVQAPLEVQA